MYNKKVPSAFHKYLYLYERPLEYAQLKLIDTALRPGVTWNVQCLLTYSVFPACFYFACRTLR